ncbi:hypothetical protein [Spiroplasma alleghenense]|uniref:Uncharacterized protein n=1 Tax=Spiroplasma alleghenense TaxID=216931 RepID=A0A345Z367_9MOLU|nr:hypothetical protein [Spiroplasma alleghenense]AXK51046.1 hypothetical protein SALLE_v1c03720 [Spiroplasma alleghenense]
MSKSAKEVLLDYQKKVKHISDDINFLINSIKLIIASCEKIDNSNIYKEELNNLLKKLTEKQYDLKTNALDKAISKDVHTATETLKEINAYLNRQVDGVAEIKQMALAIKEKVIKAELEQIKTNLKNNSFSSFSQKIENILSNITEADSHNYLKDFIDKNQNKLINTNQDNLQEYLLDELAKFNSDPKNIFEKVVNSQIEQFKTEPDLLSIINESKLKISKEISQENLSRNINSFLQETEHKIASEVTRKEVVIKIIKAIRDVGFVVNKEDVIRAKMGSKVMILAQKPTGETAQFAVDLDGSYIYNFEGYEGKEHDYDSDDFIQKLREFGLATSEEFDKVYRQPSFVAKKSQSQTNINKKKKSN